ncbi:hypothetical protein [Lutibacter sp.]
MDNKSKRSIVDKLTGKVSVILLIITLSLIGGLKLFISSHISQEKKNYVEKLLEHSLQANKSNRIMKVIYAKHDSSYNLLYDIKFINKTKKDIKKSIDLNTLKNRIVTGDSNSCIKINKTEGIRKFNIISVTNYFDKNNEKLFSIKFNFGICKEI